MAEVKSKDYGDGSLPHPLSSFSRRKNLPKQDMGENLYLLFNLW